MAAKQNAAAAAETPPSPPGAESGPIGEAAAVWVETTALRAWSKNPRKNAAAIAEVARSIKRFGFGAPILARPDGEIIAGHTRWEAAKTLGLGRVPVRYLQLDPAEAHILALADNKLGELAEWDDTLLRQVLADAKAADVDLLDGTGFSKDDVDGLLADVAAAHAAASVAEGDGQEAPQPVVQYTIIFDDERQQARWFEFLRRLRRQYPQGETVAARLHAFLEDAIRAEPRG